MTEGIWHKTAVPLFVERFVLVILAGLFLAVAITNPMRLDNTQRVTASLAIVFAAYFVAHSIYKYTHTVAPKFFAVDVFQTFIFDQNGHFWVANEDEKLAFPADFYLLIRLTNTDDSPLVVDNFRVDVKDTKNQWRKLTLLSYELPSSLKLFWGDSLKSASRVTIEPSSLRLDSPLGPKEPRTGILLCEFPSPISIPQPLRFRISILDNNRRLSVVEPDLPNPDAGQNSWAKITISKETVDLSSFKEKRY